MIFTSLLTSCKHADHRGWLTLCFSIQGVCDLFGAAAGAHVTEGPPAAERRGALQMWVKLWSQVLTDVISDGVTGNRVILDILNEPDAANFLYAPTQFACVAECSCLLTNIFACAWISSSVNEILQVTELWPAAGHHLA